MELATPITIYWDLPPGNADPASCRRIGADIAACRLLMLQLYLPDRESAQGVSGLLEALGEKKISISLTLPPDALDINVISSFRDLGVTEILLAVERSAALSPEVVEFFTPREGDPPRPMRGISFSINRDNWRQLPALLDFCRQQSVRRLVLPMQRLYHAEAPFFLTKVEQQELSRSLAAAGGTGGLSLTIHDPFLWRAFHPTVPFPQGGCQAANTMMAIAPDGGVYPCPTLPVRIGDTGATSLAEIINSPAKKEFRRRLLDVPEGCRHCEEIAECRGGCRGRALALNGSLDGIDVACQ